MFSSLFLLKIYNINDKLFSMILNYFHVFSILEFRMETKILQQI